MLVLEYFYWSSLFSIVLQLQLSPHCHWINVITWNQSHQAISNKWGMWLEYKVNFSGPRENFHRQTRQNLQKCLSCISCNSTTIPVALRTCQKKMVPVSPTLRRPRCAQRQRRSKVKHSPLLWSCLWGDGSHPRPWLRKNIPLSEAKGHHVISSCACKGRSEQVILILETWDSSQLHRDLFSVPRQIAQFPLLPNFPNCKIEIITVTFLLRSSDKERGQMSLKWLETIV